MKKIAFMLMAVVCMIAVSCGKSVDPAAVADRIQSGETLTQEDYTAMIDYCADYAKKAQKYYDIINAPQTDSLAAADATSQLATLAQKNIYLDTFRTALENADASQLGEANVKKVNELYKYEAFPIPDISDSAMLNPAVVGDIEEMPANDTGAVIATGDGEAVDVQVK